MNKGRFLIVFLLAMSAGIGSGYAAGKNALSLSVMNAPVVLTTSSENSNADTMTAEEKKDYCTKEAEDPDNRESVCSDKVDGYWVEKCYAEYSVCLEKDTDARCKPLYDNCLADEDAKKEDVKDCVSNWSGEDTETYIAACIDDLNKR